MTQRSFSNTLGLLAAMVLGIASCAGGDGTESVSAPGVANGEVAPVEGPTQPLSPAVDSVPAGMTGTDPALPGAAGEPLPPTNPVAPPTEPVAPPAVAPPAVAPPAVAPGEPPAEPAAPPAAPMEPVTPPAQPVAPPTEPTPPTVPIIEVPPMVEPAPAEPPPTPREGSADGTGPFIEHDGLIVIEVESVAAAGPWRARTEQEGFTGDAYYVATAGDGAALEYQIRIVNPGTYQLFAYGNQLGAAWDAANDVFLTVPGAKAVDGFADVSQGRHKWYIGSHRDHELPSHSGPDREERIRLRRGLTNEWRWWMYTEDPRQPVRVQFDAGVHEIHIRPRSSGFALDRVALVRWQDGDAVMPVDEAAEALVQAPQSYRDE